MKTFSAKTMLLIASMGLCSALLTAPRNKVGFSSAPTRVWRRNGVSSLVAKKGKSDVPINKRGGYVQQQNMQEMANSMRPDPNGMPVFQLFVQTPRANMWYPCGSFVGDANAKNLVEGWMGNAMLMGGFIKGQIDRSVATTLFEGDSRRKFVKNIVTQYPSLKSAQRDLVFGYKIAFDGLEEAKGTQEMMIITEEMKKGPLDGIKEAFNFGQ
uniref:Uncharacterized protein n=2 Tax=Octactis speculum TaxID=3111310 RepID=A0A7S2H120_9STRA|mmetsp:Transcript_60150/g.82448  ORF Transcript_60150/g.82448 Transcript_60150/m.82448 type:complete len:212 (+) Transcript_60150:46-681(+)|eukprot:CAMPEP_0185767018 /NCGR_PEP_ID=MMETSP1174-20130828/40918_1 /TAXON_ID=35687 /ORGANISM="Dictyocha speculum, Strain CCMP1381" /LENGTH=211 /DNA_ID=CAMNT_0028450991 /DNA_START=41 /DNA_END=676 /DNA_ORIENTATION=+